MKKYKSQAERQIAYRLRKGEFTQKDKAVAVVGCLKHMLDQINNELLPKIELIAHIVCEDSEKKRRVNG